MKKVVSRKTLAHKLAQRMGRYQVEAVARLVGCKTPHSMSERERMFMHLAYDNSLFHGLEGVGLDKGEEQTTFDAAGLSKEAVEMEHSAELMVEAVTGEEQAVETSAIIEVIDTEVKPADEMEDIKKQALEDAERDLYREKEEDSLDSMLDDLINKER